MIKGFLMNQEGFSAHAMPFILSFTACCEIENSSNLDKILCDGDTLYRHVINSLKAQGKFVQPLLSLEEIQDDFEVEVGKYPIVSGILMDTHKNLGLPTLHNALHSAFTSTTSGLLTTGVICSAIFKKKNLYVFFDSHSHGMAKMDFHQLMVDQF